VTPDANTWCGAYRGVPVPSPLLRPQHNNAPLLLMEHVWRPSEYDANEAFPAASTVLGVNRGPPAPLPTCPYVLAPQQRTAPPTTAHSDEPTDTSVTLDATTSTGVSRSTPVPSPTGGAPQQRSAPWTTAQVFCSAAVTAVTPEATTITGCSALFLVLSPTSPKPL
jgi:hypothetical protein